ncbi:MAG: hypothetical protein P8O23_00335, partial [Opitutales bacterium]|nr:hypothetical protein [Opitutales bacterium]
MKTFFFPLLISTLAQLLMGQIETTIIYDSNKTILEAENEVFWDEKLQRFIAYPNAILRSNQLLLQANRIEYDRNAGTVYAQGKVILSDGIVRLLANHINLDLISGDFNSSRVKFMIYPWAIQSQQLMRQNYTIQGLNSEVYFLEKGKNQPSLRFRELKWKEEEEILIAENISILIGDHKVGWLPSFSGRTKYKNIKHNLRAGKKSNLGWYLGTEGKWKLGSNIQIDADITAYSQRGVLLSPGIEWDSSIVESLYTGSVRGGWINDQGDFRGNDLLGSPIDSDRSFIRAYSINQPRENWRIAGQLEWNEDSEVYRDFQRDRFPENQWNDSFGEITYEGKNWTISSLTRWQANQYESAVEQIPNLRIDLAPTPLVNTKFYNSIAIEFSALRQKGNFGEILQNSNKLDLGYEIVRPFQLGNGLIYSPHLSYRRQDYSMNGPNANRSMCEWGNNIRYEVAGDYDWGNTTWNINQIRHVMGFAISHRKVNRMSANQETLIPQIDNPFVELNLRPIDLMDHIEADGLTPYEVVRLGWENQFLTRSGDQTRKIASVNFFQDIYHKKENLDDIAKEFFTGFSIQPAPWVSLTGQSKINSDEGKVIRNSFSAQFIDGNVNTLEVGYFKYLSFSDQWRLSANHRWDERKSF